MTISLPSIVNLYDSTIVHQKVTRQTIQLTTVSTHMLSWNFVQAANANQILN